MVPVGDFTIGKKMAMYEGLLKFGETHLRPSRVPAKQHFDLAFFKVNLWSIVVKLRYGGEFDMDWIKILRKGFHCHNKPVRMEEN